MELFYVCHNNIEAGIFQKIFQFFYKYLYIINYMNDKSYILEIIYMNKVILFLWIKQK